MLKLVSIREFTFQDECCFCFRLDDFSVSSDDAVEAGEVWSSVVFCTLGVPFDGFALLLATVLPPSIPSIPSMN